MKTAILAAVAGLVVLAGSMQAFAQTSASDCDEACMQGLTEKVQLFFVKGDKLVVRDFTETPYFGKDWSRDVLSERTYEIAYNKVAYDINGVSTLSYYDMLGSQKKATVLYVLQHDVSLIPEPTDPTELPSWAVSVYEDMTTFELYDLLGEFDPDEEEWY